MKVRDIMSSPPVVLSVDASAAHVAQVLIRHCVSAVPIVDDEGFLVGLVSEADLVACETHGASLNVTVAREVMTTDVAVTYPIRRWRPRPSESFNSGSGACRSSIEVEWSASCPDAICYGTAMWPIVRSTLPLRRWSTIWRSAPT